MKKQRILRTLFIMAILIVNIGCDQISKNIVRKTIDYNEQISLIDRFLILTKIENTGAFLSMGNTLSEPLRILLLIILPVIILGFVVIFLLTKKGLSKFTVLGLCFAVGGGIGNIYDRFVYGSVTDFLHIDFVLFQTGIFNMADVSIMIGMFVMLLDFYYTGKRPNNRSLEKIK